MAITEISRRDTLKRLGPREKPSALPCPACGQRILQGQYTTYVALGPGNDPQARGLARRSKEYVAVSVEVHWACATGQEQDVTSAPRP